MTWCTSVCSVGKRIVGQERGVTVVFHDATILVVQVPSVFRDDNTFWHARGATGEQQAVDVVLMQLRKLTAQLAQREVRHANACEREHGVVSAVDGRYGL